MSSTAMNRSEEQSLLGRLAVNFGWLGFQKIAVILIGIVTTGVVARYLGPENSGVLDSAQALAAFFGIAAMGIDGAVMTTWLTRHPEKEAAILGGTACVLAVTGGLSWAALAVYAWLQESASWPVRIAAVLTGLRMLLMFPAPVAMWFQHRMITREITVANVAGTLASRGWQLMTSVAALGVLWVALADVVCFAVVTVVSVRAYLRHGQNPLKWKADWHSGLCVLIESIPGLVAAGLVTFLSKLDVLMLNSMVGNAETGFFGAASRMTESLMFFNGMLATLFAPVLANSFQASRAVYESRQAGYMRLTAMMGWGFALLLCLGAPWIIRVVFGGSFVTATGVLVVHGFLLVPSMLGAAMQCMLAVERKLIWMLPMLGVALALDAVLNWLLIPSMGARGAALASVLASLMAYLVVPLFIPATRRLAWLAASALLLPVIRPCDLQAFRQSS